MSIVVIIIKLHCLQAQIIRFYYFMDEYYFIETPILVCWFPMEFIRSKTDMSNVDCATQICAKQMISCNVEICILMHPFRYKILARIYICFVVYVLNYTFNLVMYDIYKHVHRWKLFVEFSKDFRILMCKTITNKKINLQMSSKLYVRSSIYLAIRNYYYTYFGKWQIFAQNFATLEMLQFYNKAFL